MIYLWGEADNFFTQAFDAEDYAPVSTIETKSSDHGRVEKHKVWITSDLDWLEKRTEWKGLSSLVCVEREWTNGSESKKEKRFYISSLIESPEKFSELIRRHWAIENEYHWHLDVTFKEDDSEISARSNRILRVARTIALQLLKAEPNKKMSIVQKKRRCHRSQTFLRHVLTIGNF